jgi:hypothetical protein
MTVARMFSASVSTNACCKNALKYVNDTKFDEAKQSAQSLTHLNETCILSNIPFETITSKLHPVAQQLSITFRITVNNNE